MSKLLLSLSALAVVGLALPASHPAAAEEKIIIKDHRHHGDYGRYHRDWGYGRYHRDHKTVIIKKRD